MSSAWRQPRGAYRPHLLQVGLQWIHLCVLEVLFLEGGDRLPPLLWVLRSPDNWLTKGRISERRLRQAIDDCVARKLVRLRRQSAAEGEMLVALTSRGQKIYEWIRQQVYGDFAWIGCARVRWLDRTTVQITATSEIAILWELIPLANEHHFTVPFRISKVGSWRVGRKAFRRGVTLTAAREDGPLAPMDRPSWAEQQLNAAMEEGLKKGQANGLLARYPGLVRGD